MFTNETLFAIVIARLHTSFRNTDMTLKKASIYSLLICIVLFLFGHVIALAKPLLGNISEIEYQTFKKVCIAIALVSTIYAFKYQRQAGIIFKINWRTLPLYWPIGLTALLTLASATTDTPITTLITIGVLTLAVGIGEEVVFRGLIFHWFEQLNLRKRILVSALIFGGFHLSSIGSVIPTPVVFAQVFFAAGLGLIFAYARSKDYSIILPILVHALFDFIAIGGQGGVSKTFGNVEQMVAGLLFSGSIAWSWGLFLLWKIGKTKELPLSEASAT